MRIIVVGATGTIGSEIVKAVKDEHEIVEVSRSKAEINMDLVDKRSIEKMYDEVGDFDAVLCAAGVAKFGELENLTDEDLQVSASNKQMGQINLIREGIKRINDNGLIVVTTGILAQEPIKGSAAISMANAGVEGFVRAAALEAPRGIRVNAVSPPWVYETLEKMGKDPHEGKPADKVASVYERLLTNNSNGEIVRFD